MQSAAAQRVGSSVYERRFGLAAAAVLLVLATGPAGYVLIEGVGWFDAMYMTVITVTTVGFSEIFPLGTGGRVFTIFVALFGVGTILYVAGVFAEYVISGQLGGLIGQRRMNRQISQMNLHYLICGYGRTGEHAASELTHEGRDVVIVDSDETAVARAIQHGYVAVLGDSGHDEVLLQAGIDRAAGLVAATAPDAAVLM